MGAKFTIQDHSDIVLKKLDANAINAMDSLAEVAMEAIQNKMLYGYHTPHGRDGHTEIVETGRLFDSIQAEAKKQSQNLYTVNAGTSVKYAPYVHDGTYKLQGRPFITDGLIDSQEEQQNALVNNLRQGF